VEEFFAKGQKGSSAMPHKRNPIGSENMTGLARVIRGHMVTAYENVALWHERDISHSSAERIIAPDTTILIDYMLNRFGNIVKNLTVFPENMIRNMNSTFGLIFSQRAMLTLIEKGMTREQAYDLVQPKTAQSWDNQVDFKPLLESDLVSLKKRSTKSSTQFTTLNVLMKSSNALVWVTNLNKITESRFALLFLMVTFMSLVLFLFQPYNRVIVRKLSERRS